MAPTAGNNTTENASDLVNQTFGGLDRPLFSNVRSLVTNGSSGSVYDVNNNVADGFDVDGTSDTVDAYVV